MEFLIVSQVPNESPGLMEMYGFYDDKDEVLKVTTLLKQQRISFGVYTQMEVDSPIVDEAAETAGRQAMSISPEPEYPTRCQIVDVTGVEVIPGIEGRTPEESKPHVGKQGLAEEVGGDVRITLDDGTILWGYDCWWTPLEDEAVKAAEGDREH